MVMVVGAMARVCSVVPGMERNYHGYSNAAFCTLLECRAQPPPPPYAPECRRLLQPPRHAAVAYAPPPPPPPPRFTYAAAKVVASPAPAAAPAPAVTPSLWPSVAAAGAALTLAGAVSIALSLYMVLTIGRRYFLDCSILESSIALLLGTLGCQTRRQPWPPNRNYVSGFIVLAAFSWLAAFSLGAMLMLSHSPSGPMIDIIGGVVCGFSVLTIVLAAIGTIASHCCQLTPPDSRVQHCVLGFSV